MSKNLSRCYAKLQFIASTKNLRLRIKLLEEFFDECLYKAIHEISLNYTKGNIPANKRIKSQLQRYMRILKRLSIRTKNKHMQKKLVKQSGGFLPILMSLLSAVPGIISSLT